MMNARVQTANHKFAAPLSIRKQKIAHESGQKDFRFMQEKRFPKV